MTQLPRYLCDQRRWQKVARMLDRIPPALRNVRLRRLAEGIALKVRAEERRDSEAAAFEKLQAPRYARFGQRLAESGLMEPIDDSYDEEGPIR